MLDAFIIEEIKKRQQEELAQELNRPRLEIPIYIPYPTSEPKIDETKKETVVYFEI